MQPAAAEPRTARGAGSRSRSYSSSSESSSELSSDPEARAGEACRQLPSNLVKDAASEVRLGFVRKVYGILSTQLLVTVAIAAPIATMDASWIKGHRWLLQLSFCMTMVTICAITCCKDAARRFPSNYAFLFTFTVFEAIVLGFVSATYTWQSVALAAGTTCVIFTIMTVYAWRTKTDFTGLGPYLFAALSALCVFGFTLCLLSYLGVGIHWAMMFYDACGVLLFTFYIVYDTQLLIGEYGGHQAQFTVDDYVFAALNLYLDIVNLFLYILSLFGNRSE